MARWRLGHLIRQLIGLINISQDVDPILHGVEGESASIIETEDVGLLFEPQNSNALIDELRKLADNPDLLSHFRSNGPQATLRFDRSVLALRILEVVEQVSALRCDKRP